MIGFPILILACGCFSDGNVMSADWGVLAMVN